MSARLLAGRFFARAGQFIQSLGVVIMKPDDLLELSRRSYGLESSVDGWSEAVDQGLSPIEAALLAAAPLKKGRLLLLGVGGGREAVALAKAGFEVTGVDFVPAMVERARKNVLERGTRMEAQVWEVSRWGAPAGSFDVVWLSGGGLYSTVPTRRKRVELLKSARVSLRPGGRVVCMFCFAAGREGPGWGAGDRLRKGLAFAVRGNVGYQRGDVLWGGKVFCHHFQSAEELRSEFAEGGFEVLQLKTRDGCGSGALLRGDSAEGEI